jgi:hypothetical protein
MPGKRSVQLNVKPDPHYHPVFLVIITFDFIRDEGKLALDPTYLGQEIL